MIGRTISLFAVFTLGTSMAARQGAIPMAAHQICVQIWLAVSLLSDSLALAGQVKGSSPFRALVDDCETIKMIELLIGDGDVSIFCCYCTLSSLGFDILSEKGDLLDFGYYDYYIAHLVLASIVATGISNSVIGLSHDLDARFDNVIKFVLTYWGYFWCEFSRLSLLVPLPKTIISLSRRLPSEYCRCVVKFFCLGMHICFVTWCC